MSDVQKKAATFAQAHESGDLLVLPTVWDAWSARLAESAGFQGLTVGSHPVGDALGPGAVGINIEDTVRRENGRMRDRDEHAQYIADARAAADQAGVDLVINGRTDPLVHGTTLFEDPLAEAVERIRLLEQAGARSVYPVGLPDGTSAAAAVAAVSVPVNVTAHPVNGAKAGTLVELRELGVRRISFGPLWQAALAETSRQQLASWTN